MLYLCMTIPSGFRLVKRLRRSARPGMPRPAGQWRLRSLRLAAKWNDPQGRRRTCRHAGACLAASPTPAESRAGGANRSAFMNVGEASTEEGGEGKEGV